jgi:hypothetical protein
MTEHRTEIASYVARVRRLMRARAEFRPASDLPLRDELVQVQATLIRMARALHREIRQEDFGDRLRLPGR